MTIIAAFQCSDGLLMCADSEQSVFGSDTKSQTRKIDAFKSGHASAVIGGSGDTGVIEYVQYEFMQRIAKDRPKWEDADKWLQSFAKDMWNICVRPYRGLALNPIPTADFLVGLQMFGSYGLYGLDGNMVRKIPAFKPHVSIGAGSIQAESLLSDLQALHFAASNMLLYAVRVMLRVKQLVQGCGGKTEVVLLKNDGLVVKLGTVTIDAIERLVEEIDLFFVDQPLRFISGVVDANEADDFKTQTDCVKDFSERYKDCLPASVYPRIRS